MHSELVAFTENLVGSLVKEPDLVKVQEFLGDKILFNLKLLYLKVIWELLLVEVEKWLQLFVHLFKLLHIIWELIELELILIHFNVNTWLCFDNRVFFLAIF